MSVIFRFAFVTKIYYNEYSVNLLEFVNLGATE